MKRSMKMRMAIAVAAVVIPLGLVGAGVAVASASGRAPAGPYKTCANSRSYLTEEPTNGHCAPGSFLVTIGKTGKNGKNGRNGTNGTDGTNGVGTPGATGPAGAPGVGTPGAPGATGATGATGPTELNSWSECTDSLCLDAPPEGPNGLDGSSGWGWDNTTNLPVSSVAVGSDASFTVTVLQGNPAEVPGTITLTWSSADFTLNDTSNGGTVGTNPFDRGGVETFSYDSDFFGHNDQSDSYTFTAVGADPSALVTATVSENGQTASETFPIAIVAASAG
jgi:hypothetical protein